MSLCVSMCVQVHIHMPGVAPQVLSTMSFQQFLMYLTSLVRMGWLTQGSTRLLHPDARITGACHHTRILSVLWVLSWSPHACTMSSLQPAERSLQSRKTMFLLEKKKMVSKVLNMHQKETSIANHECPWPVSIGSSHGQCVTCPCSMWP